MTRACKKRLSAHGFFSRGLHFIQDKKPASRADRGLILVNEPLSRLCLSRFDVSAMDFKQCPIEIHERAGPRIEGADAAL
jgi:hypothetical protein